MFDLDRQTHSVEVREAVSRVHHKSLVRHPHTQNSNANVIDCTMGHSNRVPQLVFSYRFILASLWLRTSRMALPDLDALCVQSGRILALGRLRPRLIFRFANRFERALLVG